MPSPPNTQLINGNAYDHSSIAINVDGARYLQVESIEWNDSLEPGKLSGASAFTLARTRGKYDADGNIKMSLADSDALIKAFGHGYMTKVFTITCTYSEPNQPVSKVDLIGCRFVKTADSSSGGDPTMRTHDLHILRIVRNGIDPVGKPGNLGTGAPV